MFRQQTRIMATGTTNYMTALASVDRYTAIHCTYLQYKESGHFNNIDAIERSKDV